MLSETAQVPSWSHVSALSDAPLSPASDTNLYAPCASRTSQAYCALSSQSVYMMRSDWISWLASSSLVTTDSVLPSESVTVWMNQTPLRRAVVVHSVVLLYQVIVFWRVSCPPFTLTMNNGSVWALAGGGGGGLRQVGLLGDRILLSQASVIIGKGKVACTKRL